MSVTEREIETKIYLVRGQKVMLDIDLANLYDVETKRLNEQVKRNIKRFPLDFMFQMTNSEHESLISQNVISKSGLRGRRQNMPFVFTENGVAMLSSILNSDRAIMVNISIMRIFTKLRSFLLLEKNLNDRIDDLEDNTKKVFKIVFERLDSVDEKITPVLPKKRKKMGLIKE